jgi:hypothetical protein
MVVVVIRHDTKAAARRTSLFIVRALANDTITVAVWTGLHRRPPLAHDGNAMGRALAGSPSALPYGCPPLEIVSRDCDRPMASVMFTQPGRLMSAFGGKADKVSLKYGAV